MIAGLKLKQAARSKRFASRPTLLLSVYANRYPETPENLIVNYRQYGRQTI
jgi:hypothetical protein